MAPTSLAEDKKSLVFIKSWYDDQRTALAELRAKVIESAMKKSVMVDEKFNDFSSNQIIEYFEESLKELDYLAAFDLLSAAEAEIRTDFLNKVKDKNKSETGRRFRAIYKEKGEKVSLEQDILEILKETIPSKKSDISSFLGALKYRHWIAHGRYWTPKLGRIYGIDVVYAISSDMLDIVNM